MTYNIRGTTSINGGEPLVLVNNVPMDINMIDPQDIESVSILKDALPQLSTVPAQLSV